MKKKLFKINNIPAILWGEESGKIYIYVHGKFSNKDEANDFSKIAIKNKYQVLSFDLPEHGERKTEKYPCNIWNGINDLNEIYNYVKKSWENIFLYGCSLGAFFSLLAYKNYPIVKALFVSPVLNMELLIENIMRNNHITEEILKTKHIIPNMDGETLDWDYYRFIKENKIESWGVPTYILCGSNDNLTEKETINNFIDKFNAKVNILENGEHWFHTTEQIKYLNKWLEEVI
jgi:esterase/lipase